MKIYIVPLITNSRTVRVLGYEQDLDLTWYDDMIGVMPVFKDKETAIKYSDGRAEILEAEVEGEEK